jgi:hypothetical protein
MLHRININLLLQAPLDNTFYSIRVAIDSLSLETPNDFALPIHPEIGLKVKKCVPLGVKAFNIRNLRIHFRKKVRPEKITHMTFLESLRTDSTGLLLSPFNAILISQLYQDMSLSKPLSILNATSIISELSLTCLDINPSFDELTMVSEAIDHVSYSIMKTKLAPVRQEIFGCVEPVTKVEITKRNALTKQQLQQMWRFAIKSVVKIMNIREKTSNVDRLSTAFRQLRPKLRYAHLWNRLIRQIFTSRLLVDQDDTNPANSSPLSVEEEQELRLLESSIPRAQLTVLRRLLIDKLLWEGFSVTDIAHGIVASSRESIQKDLQSFDLPSRNDDDGKFGRFRFLLTSLIRNCFYIAEYVASVNDLWARHCTVKWTMKCFITLEDISLCVFRQLITPKVVPISTSTNRDPRHYPFHFILPQTIAQEEKLRRQQINSNNAETSPDKYVRVASILVMCVKTAVEIDNNGEHSYSLMIGSCHVFGRNNFAMLRLGNSDLFQQIVDYGHVYDPTLPDYCVSISIRVLNHVVEQHRQAIRKTVSKLYLSDVTLRGTSAFVKPSPKRVFTEIRIRDVWFLWHGESVVDIQSMGKLFDLKMHSLSRRSDEFNSESSLSELRCKSLSNTTECIIEEKFRLSVEISIISVRFLFALSKNSSSLNDLRGITKFMELSLQKCYGCSGDYLESIIPRNLSLSSKPPQSTRIGTSSMLSPGFLDPLVEATRVSRKERNFLVRPRLLMLEGACIRYCELQNKDLVGSSSLSTTKARQVVSSLTDEASVLSPWNVGGVWIPSFSKGHQDFTDNRFDVFCGNLKVVLDAQVMSTVL